MANEIEFKIGELTEAVTTIKKVLEDHVEKDYQAALSLNAKIDCVITKIKVGKAVVIALFLMASFVGAGSSIIFDKIIPTVLAWMR